MSTRGQYGGRTYASGPVTIEPRFAAMRRAVRAVFDTYNRVRAPYYVYAEVNGIVDVAPAQSDTEAYARFDMFDRAPGEVYAAVFATAEAAWPDPAHQSYHAALPARAPAVAGRVGRGQYGISVGEGSILPHPPGETENELDLLHNEIMQFGQEVIEKEKTASAEQAASNPEVQQLRAVEQVLEAYVKSLQSLPVQAADRIDAVKKARAATEKRQAAELRLPKPPLLEWIHSAWKPFLDGWITWHSTQKTIPFQMWPMSGAWDHIQDERARFIDLRRAAPFKSVGPAPTGPHKDPSLTDVFGEIGKFAKWGLIGILGIGGIVALSSVATNVRKGRDPIEHYTQLYRGRRVS